MDCIQLDTNTEYESEMMSFSLIETNLFPVVKLAKWSISNITKTLQNSFLQALKSNEVSQKYLNNLRQSYICSIFYQTKTKILLTRLLLALGWSSPGMFGQHPSRFDDQPLWSDDHLPLKCILFVLIPIIICHVTNAGITLATWLITLCATGKNFLSIVVAGHKVCVVNAGHLWSWTTTYDESSSCATSCNL